MPNLDLTILHRIEQSKLVEIGHHFFPRLVAIETSVRSSRLRKRAVCFEDIDNVNLILMPPPDLVVIRVMGRGNLHAAAAELRLGPLIADQGNRPVEQGKHHHPPSRCHLCEFIQSGQVTLTAGLEARELLLYPLPVAIRSFRKIFTSPPQQFVKTTPGIGMTSYRRIPQHGLRTRGGDRDKLRLTRLRVDHRIADVPEMTGNLLVIDLIITDGRLQVTIPVDQPVAAINQAVAEHIEEGPAHRSLANRIHGEALPVPVTGATHALLLRDDALLVLVLPFPDPLHQLLTADVVAGLSLKLKQAFLNHGLGGDPRMISPRHPEGIVSPHPVPAGQEILHHVVHGMPHVQGPRYIGKRHHDDIAVFTLIGRSGKGLLGEPPRIDVPLNGGRIVLLWELSGHGIETLVTLGSSATQQVAQVT